MGGKATRVAFGEALLKVAAKNDRVVVINADLGKSTNTVKFVEKYPDRSFNVGVAEANMIGIGAGLALEGWIPFICTFAIFVAGGVADPWVFYLSKVFRYLANWCLFHCRTCLRTTIFSHLFHMRLP